MEETLPLCNIYQFYCFLLVCSDCIIEQNTLKEATRTMLWPLFGLLFSSFPQQAFAVCSGKSSQDNLALRAHTYRSLIADSYVTCFEECSSDVNCMSLNFCLVHFICELNHQTSITKPGWYKYKKYSIYAEPLAKRHPSEYSFRKL